MTIDDLLPCPWCGATNVFVLEGSTCRWVRAECVECGASCGERRRDLKGIRLWLEEDQEIALSAWNDRKNSSITRIAELESVLRWIALNTFEGVEGVEGDRYEYATKVANENGREEATEADEVEGFIRMVSHAIERGKV